MSKSSPLVPVNVILHGDRIIVDVIKLRILRQDHPGFRVSSKSNDWYPYKRKERQV